MFRSLPYLTVVLLLLITRISLAQCPATIPFTAGTVATTESRCQSTGTATISVSGGSIPYIFSIIAGPVTVASQSSSLFQSLPPGNYTARAIDNCNTTLNIGFTITGSYTVPQPVTTITAPSCQGGNNGRIQVDVTGGRLPYSYALISPSPVIVPDQPGNVFTGLTAGTYTYRITDSCGNFQTRNVLLADKDNGAFQIENLSLHYEDCDSFSISYLVTPLALGNYRPPYSMQLTLPDGSTYSHEITAADIDPALANVRDTFYFHYHHISGTSGLFEINGINDCGATNSYTLSSSILNLTTQTTALSDCSGQYTYTFDPSRDNSPGVPDVLRCATITYRLYNAAGILLATQINNSTFSGFAPGNYQVVRQDCCRADSLTFTWSTVPVLQIVNYSLYKDMACKEGTVALDLHIEPAITGNIIIASGPPSVTFANGQVHTYQYPDTLKNIPFGNIPNNINYFTTGTYKIYVTDSCAHKDSITVSITPADLRRSGFTATLVKGCTDANMIRMQATSNTNSFASDGYIYCYPGDFDFTPTAYPFSDSISNLSADTYDISYHYTTRTSVNNYLHGMRNIGCDVISRTIVVPPYQQPRFTIAAVASCGVLRNVALLADSSRGVAPFQYQISSGGSATALQPNPVFQNLPAGIYALLIADACGNSYSASIAVDTLVVPRPAVIGSLCINNVASLRMPSNPYISYQWKLPSGSTVTGDSLYLNPVSQADVGAYVVTGTSNIAGCTDSRQMTFNVQNCNLATLSNNQVRFTGQRQDGNMVLQWQINKDATVDHFIVQRSANGIRFDGLQHVQADRLSGNTYKAIDRQLLAGVSYYRLKIIHTDGLVTYSSIVLCINRQIQRPEVFPTLVTPGASLMVIYPAVTQNSYVPIISIEGKVQFTRQLPAGTTYTPVDVSTLTPGHYFVAVTYNGIKTVVKVLKL